MNVVRRAIVLLALASFVAACQGGATSPTPITADEAAAAALAQDARFAGIGPRDPDLIGQSAWFEVTPAAADGFDVAIVMGWGDCPAGCIESHRWDYAVSSTGTVTLRSEGGEPLPDAEISVRGTITAGPTCPVVTLPPDPACADRPVAGAVIIVTDSEGHTVGMVTSAADGSYQVALPSGNFTLTPHPLGGLMGTPAAQVVAIEPGGGTAVLDFAYDTGIR